MELLFSFMIATILVLFGKTLRKYEISAYLIALIICVFSYIYGNDNIVFVTINKGYIAFTLWIFVGFTTLIYLPKQVKKRLIPIRKHLSILGFIFTSFHLLANFFIRFDLYLIIGYISFIIMIPLTITSFISIRKKMNSKSWKKLHRSAYVAYILMFLHMILVTRSLLNLIIYTILLAIYIFFKFEITEKIILRMIGIFLVLVITGVRLFTIVPIFEEANYSTVIEVEENEIVKDISVSDTSTLGEENKTTVEIEEENKTTVEVEEENTPGYTDGVYTTTVDAFGPDMVVETTIENGLIISVEIISHNEKKYEYYGPAFEQIPTDIIDTQSTEVDSVSGSTYSSNGIKKAVDLALEEATQ